MRFNTHNRTPKIETKKSVKIMLTIGFGFMISILIFLAIVFSFYINSFMPAVLILTPVLVLSMLITIPQKDMERAFIEIIDDTVIAEDYYLGIRIKKTFLLRDIAEAEVLVGYSIRVRGYRYSNAGCSYIVFRDKSGKYMFKVICVPETKDFFEYYLK